MWPIPLNPRAIFLAVGVIAACAVLGCVRQDGCEAGRAAGDREVKKMCMAGMKVLAERDRRISENLETYREDIAAVSSRPPKRVFFCPPGDLPQTPGRTAGSGATVIDRHDYGPDLRKARDALIRCNTLIGIVR